MASQSSTARRKSLRNGQILWTYDMKLSLHIMHTEFDLTGAQMCQVFNVVFEAHLLAAGCDVSESKLNFQYGMKAREGRAEAEWSVICGPASDPAESQKRDALRSRIRNAAEAQGIIAEPSRLAKDIKVFRFNNRAAQSPMTLANSARGKRVRVELEEETSSDEEFSPIAKRTIRQTTVRSVTAVQVRTPKAKKQRNRTTYTRPDGTSFQATVNQLKTLGRPLEIIPDAEAHPQLPSLLFRCWTEQTSPDHNSRTAFCARKFWRHNAIDPGPPAQSITDVVNHIDRANDKSPYISTSNRLIWIIREALQRSYKDGSRNHLITIIDSSKLKSDHVFYALPFQKMAADYRAAFHEGAWRFTAHHEFLVWQQIPHEALLHTINIEELQELTEDDAVRRILRLPLLQTGNLSSAKKQKLLREEGIPLNDDIVRGMARIATALGLSSRLANIRSQIEQIVASLVEGFCLRVNHKSDEVWASLANSFAIVFCRKAGPYNLRHRQDIERAFLDGVCIGLGDFNIRLKPAKVMTMIRRAKRVGLQMTFDGGKVHLKMFDDGETTQAPLPSSNIAATVADDDDDVDDYDGDDDDPNDDDEHDDDPNDDVEDDNDLPESEIAYSDVDDEADELNDSVFEFDDDGYLIL